MNRRVLLQSGVVAGAACIIPLNLDATHGYDEVKPTKEKGMDWYNPEQWGVEGRGWQETTKYYDRLPSKAKETVRAAVWGLSRHSAGMLVRFKTNSPDIHVRYRLTSGNLAMNHMPATGVSGVDLYGEDGTGKLKWINVTRPSGQNVASVLARNIDQLPDNKPRLYHAYLPLYNGVERLEFGVPNNASFEPLAPRSENRILFYGTSIMHGACASRPGMCISSIVGRRLNVPVINLGFSGNGKMETEVGSLICELKPKTVAVDCLPNMTPELVKQRTENLVRLLRKNLPTTSILLVEDRAFTNSGFYQSRRKFHSDNRKQLRLAYERLIKSGVSDLHYLSGDQLLGTDGEAATDGSHPSDLGMVRYADAYENALKKLGS